MPEKIAVAIVHGIGEQKPDFAEPMRKELLERFAGGIGKNTSQAEKEICFQPVYWADLMETKESELWRRLRSGGDLDFLSLREFMVHFAADAIAYQPLPQNRDIYDDIHQRFAESLGKLAAAAGPRAPLVVISHSLGTVITSNYFYDLREGLASPEKGLIGAGVLPKIGNTELEAGKTLAWLFTMGSPIAIWSLRYENPDYGKPIAVPAPDLKNRYPNLRCGWVNIFDEDDVIGYPLKNLNDEYRNAILEDKRVNAGGLLSSWNPLSHNGYWTDDDVTKPIAAALVATWRAANPN